LQAAVFAIAGEAARAVEEGERGVGVIVDAHLGPDVVRPGGLGGICDRRRP
jgi:hypothetical protein